MIDLKILEYTFLKKGTQFARATGVFVGVHEHSHFLFKIKERGKIYPRDPWFLFWKINKDIGIKYRILFLKKANKYFL